MTEKFCQTENMLVDIFTHLSCSFYWRVGDKIKTNLGREKFEITYPQIPISIIEFYLDFI